MRARLKLNNTQKVPYFDYVQTDGNNNFAFFQDLFEIFLPTSGLQKRLLLDLSSDMPETEKNIISALANKLDATVMPVPGQLGEDDDGGNIEVTPEGIPYIGSTSTPLLRAQIKKLTGREPLVLPTQWLYVGHVDEMLTFLPSRDACGSTLVFADPLEAINLMRQFGKVPLIPREDLEGMGASIRNPETYKSEFLSSLEYFVKPTARNKQTLTSSDFDTAKPVRSFADTPVQMDIEFLGNMNASQHIQIAVATLQKARPAACAQNAKGIPSLYYSRKGASFDLDNAQVEISTGYTAVSGYLNLISLRNHVVIAHELVKGSYITPEEELKPVTRSEHGFFGPIVRKRLASILGGENLIHEINVEYFENGVGSAHCTTNVIRTAETWR